MVSFTASNNTVADHNLLHHQTLNPNYLLDEDKLINYAFSNTSSPLQDAEFLNQYMNSSVISRKRKLAAAEAHHEGSELAEVEDDLHCHNHHLHQISDLIGFDEHLMFSYNSSSVAEVHHSYDSSINVNYEFWQADGFLNEEPSSDLLEARSDQPEPATWQQLIGAHDITAGSSSSSIQDFDSMADQPRVCANYDISAANCSVNTASCSTDITNLTPNGTANCCSNSSKFNTDAANYSPGTDNCSPNTANYSPDTGNYSSNSTNFCVSDTNSSDDCRPCKSNYVTDPTNHNSNLKDSSGNSSNDRPICPNYSIQSIRYAQDSAYYSPGINDYSSVPANYSPASSNYTPIDNFSPASTNYSSVSASYTPASSNYTPASSNYTSANANYTPANANYTPVKDNYASGTTNCSPATTNYTSANTNPGTDNINANMAGVRPIWAGPTLMDIESALAASNSSSSSSPQTSSTANLSAASAASFNSSFIYNSHQIYHSLMQPYYMPSLSSIPVPAIDDINNSTLLLNSNNSYRPAELPQDSLGTSSSWRLKLQKRNQLEPKYTVRVNSEEEALDDGYKWRKYGQKNIKSSPYPRSYYKCTSSKCNAKKQVERSHEDGKLLVTYEGMHLHYRPNPLPKHSHADHHNNEKLRRSLHMNHQGSLGFTQTILNSSQSLSHIGIISGSQSVHTQHLH